jgi:hypothetical protein
VITGLNIAILLEICIAMNKWRGGAPRKLKFGNVIGGKITNA